MLMCVFSFTEYAQKVETVLLPKYQGAWHWAKIEIDRLSPAFLKGQLRHKYPIERTESERRRFDPKHILDNRITSVIFNA